MTIKLKPVDLYLHKGKLSHLSSRWRMVGEFFEGIALAIMLLAALKVMIFLFVSAAITWLFFAKEYPHLGSTIHYMLAWQSTIFGTLIMGLMIYWVGYLVRSIYKKRLKK